MLISLVYSLIMSSSFPDNLLPEHGVVLVKEHSVSQSSQVAEPLWTDPGQKSGISVRELISISKNKKQKQSASGEWMDEHSLKIRTREEEATPRGHEAKRQGCQKRKNTSETLPVCGLRSFVLSMFMQQRYFSLASNLTCSGRSHINPLFLSFCLSFFLSFCMIMQIPWFRGVKKICSRLASYFCLSCRPFAWCYWHELPNTK